MLVAERDGKRIEARNAERGPDLICPKCRRAVIFKHGRKVIAHFAHKPPTDCTLAKGETHDHLVAKELVRNEFASRGCRAEVEFTVNALPNDRRADVMVWSPSNKRVAFELQHTSIDIDEIEARAGTYAREGIARMWIPFLRPSVWTKAKSCGPGRFFIRRYSPRPFEKWVHGICGKGHRWIYDPRDRRFWRIEMRPHWYNVAESTWYAEGGEEMSAGGYDKQSKRFRELSLFGPHNLNTLRVKYWTRQAGNVPGYNWPAATIAYFVNRDPPQARPGAPAPSE